MRIAYVNAEDLTKTTGGGVHFRAVAGELANAGNTVYVVAPGYTSKPWTRFESEAVQTVRLRVPGKNVLGLFCFEAFLFLMLPWFKLKYRWEALLVRGGGPSLLMGMAFLLGRLLGMRVVLECNGVSWPEFESRGFSKLFCRYIKFSAWSQAKTASSIIGVTPAVCRAYCELAHRPIQDSYPISNGVFTEKFPLDQRSQIRREHHWEDNETIFIMPSNFSPWHGLNELIEAISLLLPECREKIRFVLPGQGEMCAEVQRRIAERGLDDCVELPGQLGRDAIYRILTAADVGLLLRPDPTGQSISFPGSPLKLFEYFGAGLPVITCSDSYHSKLIPYYTLGIVLDSMTPQALAEAIATMANKDVPFDRQKILDTARDEFHWRKVSQRVLAVLQKTQPQMEKWLIQKS
jgi:glycosyltransferase involved in cell wall biosynthesis